MNKITNVLQAYIFAAFFLVGTYVFVHVLWLHQDWRFPEVVSKNGPIVDQLFNGLFSQVTIMFIGFLVLLCFFLIRYAFKSGRKAEYSDGNSKGAVYMSVGLGVLVVILLEVTSAVIGSSFWNSLHAPTAANEMVIEVTGQQFTWTVRYPGPDGKFGRLDPTLIDDALGNTLGLDRKDPDAKDDIVLNGSEIHLPINKSIVVLIRSKDVIHDLFLPHFRIQMYATPGLNVKTRFVPIKEGEYELVCSQICGLGHYKMRGLVTIQQEAEFNEWLKEQTPLSEYL